MASPEDDGSPMWALKNAERKGREAEVAVRLASDRDDTWGEQHSAGVLHGFSVVLSSVASSLRRAWTIRRQWARLRPRGQK